MKDTTQYVILFICGIVVRVGLPTPLYTIYIQLNTPYIYTLKASKIYNI